MTEMYGYELIREQHIPELNTQARLFRHVKTGAELLSLQNDDENKVFGITFRTPPPDSSGIPHIMEHSVLCGSRKYPVKEPFVELMKGSLNTFLNAMTYPDKTCYPVASQNAQDFENLIDVYLDAVFFPRLNPYTLMQEGWHYEVDEATKSLSYKGVVFNEMKGAYSQPENVLEEQIQSSLFPNTVYRHDSGGNPAMIPSLTFEQFQKFHETYYHPSNARLFFYGDYDLDRQLMLTSEYLRQFDPIPVKSEVGLQPPINGPRRQVVPYEISEDQDNPKSYVTVNWLFPEAGDAELMISLAILEEALIGTPAAQLRKALIDSGLGEDLAGRGFETGFRQMFFSIGLKGVASQDVDQVEKLILDILASLSADGVDPENIRAALNTIEFRLRENNTGSFPRGLALMLRSLDFWLYDKDPFAPLAFEAPLNTVKARISSGEPLLERLIETFLVQNTHRTTVILNPDPELGSKRAAAEREMLDQARASMSDEEIRSIIKTSQILKERQETPDSPEMLMTIPLLDREDLEKEIRRIPSDLINIGQSTVLFHDLFTNGIFYLDLGFNLRALPQEWIPYIPLFGRALTETGTHTESFVQLLQRIGQTTGGIRHTTLTSARRSAGDSIAWFFLRGKAMASQAGSLLSILADVLSDAQLEDRERFRQMALEEKARLESRLVQAGHAVVNSRLRARYNTADWASEQMNGVSYLFFLRRLIQDIENDWPHVLQILQSIRDTLLVGSNALVNVTLDAATWKKLQPQVEDFLKRLPSRQTELKDWDIQEFPSSEGLIVPSQVNYVGKGANLFAHNYQLKGSVFVINNHLNGTFIWEKIRVQGGAYGGFAVFDNQSGVYTFLSYRDPNLVQSLENYDLAGEYLRNLQLDESELTKAIIGTIGDLDAYMLPDAKGFTSMRFHLLSLTDEERQRLRDEVLATTQDDFYQFADILDQVSRHGQIVVLGSEDAIKSANIFEEVKKVL